MSHGVHAVQHEVEHQIEHEHGGGHGKKPAQNQNKKIALLISVLALFLAISETLGKSAQTVGIELNIKASDNWNFFQAKTTRQTTLKTAAEAMAIEVMARPDDAYKAAMSEQIENWNATATRYESNPKEQDGRKEIRAKAEQFERDRDTAMARYHSYEFGSAAYQIGIVLASAAVITGMMALAYGAAGVGVIGLIFTALGLFAPDVLHDVAHWFSHWFSQFFPTAGTH
jgi:hypothetical protein